MVEEEDMDPADVKKDLANLEDLENLLVLEANSVLTTILTDSEDSILTTDLEVDLEEDLVDSIPTTDLVLVDTDSEEIEVEAEAHNNNISYKTKNLFLLLDLDVPLEDLEKVMKDLAVLLLENAEEEKEENSENAKEEKEESTNLLLVLLLIAKTKNSKRSTLKKENTTKNTFLRKDLVLASPSCNNNKDLDPNTSSITWLIPSNSSDLKTLTTRDSGKNTEEEKNTMN